MTMKDKFGYGVGIFGPMLGWVAAMQYLLFFYTDILGLSPTQAGLIFMVGMIWDAISDPVIGVIADKTRTRWGRYRPYLLFGPVPFALSIALVFYPISAAPATVFWFALAAHLFFRTAYTIVYMPFTAMIASITSSYDSRTSLTAVKTLFAFTANLIISIGLYSLVLRFGGEDEGAGFFKAAMVIAVAAASTSWICFALTREPAESLAAPKVSKKSGNAGGVLTTLSNLARNKPFLLVFFGVAIFGGFYGAQISMTAYFAKYWLGDAGLTRVLFTTQAVASILSIPIWFWIAKRFGKARAWVIGTSLAALGLILLFLVRPNDQIAMSAFYSVTNIGATGFILIFYAMTADTVDWGEWQSGIRNEGIVFGAISFANKFGAGVVTGAVGAALSAVGFIANETPSAATLNGMFFIGMLIPAAAFLIAAALMAFYPISRERHAEVIQEIEQARRDDSGSVARI